jgi:predicted AlkP superfamily pyrophosphatase or phosphodiesterase
LDILARQMKRIAAASLIFAVVITAMPLTEAAPGGVPVVLLSIDGLKPDYIIDADKYGLKIPNLRRLLSEGSYASGVRGVLPTVTYPSHTTMLTGVSPAKHGIYYNTTFDPFNKNQSGWYWYFEDVRVETLWDAARKGGLTTASVDWPVSVSAPVTYNIVQYWRTTTGDDHKLLAALSSPDLLQEAERSCGTYPAGDTYTIDADKRRADFIVWMLEHKKPRFVTCYFGGLDTEEHSSGPYSKKTFEGLEELDALVGRVRAAAEQSGGGRAIICVVSDHGFAKVSKELRLNVALRKAGLIELDERQRVKSWEASAWGSGGTAAIMLRDPQDQKTKTRLRAALRDIEANSAEAIIKTLEKEQAKASGGFPDAEFVVAVRPGWQISGSYEGQLITALPSVRGSHGYLPELQEMDSTFLIAGPRIPAAHSLGRIDMRDIAPTLANLLGLKLKAADGRNLFAGAIH